MKKLIFLFSLLSSFSSFGQFPPEFPKKLLNKVYCGNTSVYGQKYMSTDIDLSTNTNFDYKIYISETDGIYVEYNPGQKFGRDKNGTTEKLKDLALWKTEPHVHKDNYGDITGKTTTYKFKVYPDTKKNHYIKEISLTIYEDGFQFSNGEIAKEYSRLYLTINVPYHQDAELTLSSDEKECERLKTKAEIEKEEQDRIKLENQKKDADKTTLLKINDLISKNSLEDAAKEYGKLNFEYDELKSSIQKKLSDKYENEVVELNFYNVEDYIKSNKDKINSINSGNYSVKFDSKGNPLNASFPKWPTKQFKEFGSFSVKINSKADINIVIKDSILVSTVYNKSNTKPLFVDKNENFYFKSKNGLPVAQFVINPAIDKNSVNILKYYKREKYANGILIGTEGFYFEKTVEIKKKDY
jgi:hypothetical protein